MKFLCSEKISSHKYKTPEGYLICVDSVLSRTGKQTYKRSEVFADGDDSEIEINRKEEEVFSPQAIASFENKPITVEHPDEDVNTENYKEYSVGFVRDVHQGTNESGEKVLLGTLVITDQQTIDEIENGEHTDLSCGYDCDIVDMEQRNIRGNHVALCQCGRAGIAHIVDSKNALDSAEKDIVLSKEKWEELTKKNKSGKVSAIGNYHMSTNTVDVTLYADSIDDINALLRQCNIKDSYNMSSYDENILSRLIARLNYVGDVTWKDLAEDLIDNMKKETGMSALTVNNLTDYLKSHDWVLTALKKNRIYIIEDSTKDSEIEGRINPSEAKCNYNHPFHECGPNCECGCKDASGRYALQYESNYRKGNNKYIATSDNLYEIKEMRNSYFRAREYDVVIVDIMTHKEIYDSVNDYNSEKETNERIESLPLWARNDMEKSSNKKATFIMIQNAIDDIINSADPSMKQDLQMKKEKILADLRNKYLNSMIIDDNDDIETRVEIQYNTDKLRTVRDILDYVKYLESTLNVKYTGDILKYLQRRGYILYDSKIQNRDSSGVWSINYKLNGDFRTALTRANSKSEAINNFAKKIPNGLIIEISNYPLDEREIKMYKQSAFIDSIKDSKYVIYVMNGGQEEKVADCEGPSIEAVLENFLNEKPEYKSKAIVVKAKDSINNICKVIKIINKIRK